MLPPIYEHPSKQIDVDCEDYAVSNVYFGDVELLWNAIKGKSFQLEVCRPYLVCKDADSISIIEGAVANTGVLKVRNCETRNNNSHCSEHWATCILHARCL